MANKKVNQFITKKHNTNTAFWTVSVFLLIGLGFLIFKTTTFFVKNANDILNDNKGVLEKKKEFNMQAFEDLKAKRPLNK